MADLLVRWRVGWGILRNGGGIILKLGGGGWGVDTPLQTIIWSVATMELASELESDLWDTVDWVRKMLEKLNWFCVTNLLTLVLLMWKWIGLCMRKNHLLRCWDCLSLLNWIGTLTLIAIAVMFELVLLAATWNC